MLEPDYSKYSYSELLDVLEHIDRETHPDRYENARINLEGAEPTEAKPNERKRSKRFANRIAGTFLAIYSVYIAAMIIFTGYPGYRSYLHEWSYFFIESSQLRQTVSFCVLIIGFMLTYKLWKKKDD
ncbi:hypothetical protein GCM10008090_34070 [Arenicella chitinivorans]|uniref:Uncharacterized protein n=2 Tax=Arenicella chitinivorans TaxID=1329800 RepID=A0A918S309_9GAMM|nr:hypothetical protein GCM10008090_34070 [Arenicella chitinivorans]